MALIKNKIFIRRIILSGICLLFLATTFNTERRSSGWYQQFFPNLNGSSIVSMTFLDSLTGFAVTNSNTLLQQYILKTTNGGDNWFINFTFNTQNSYWSFVKIGFVDSNTGYAFSWTEMFKTTNKGNNWNIINNDLYPEDVAIINKDTMLAVSSSGFDGGVYRTTNGGLNWQLIWTLGVTSGNPNRIYMFNKYIGFSDDNSVGSRFRKTTNGGFNWILLAPDESFSDIILIDSLTGWKCSSDIKKTTDGGLTWVLQQLPLIFVNNFKSISILNINTLWGVGGFSNAYGVMYKTTNGGANWGYQLADTSIHIGHYDFIYFLNDNLGWAYRLNSGGVHTFVGGSDTTFFTGLTSYSNIVPEKFSLGQNYPNPFNPVTKIPYEIKEPSYIVLKVYDITGRMVKELVNGKWGTAKYIADFDASGLSSGIYFYRIEITGQSTKEKFIDSKKMVMIK